MLTWSTMGGGATSQPRRRPGRPKAFDRLPTQITFSYLPQKLGLTPSVQSSVPLYTCTALQSARLA